MKARCIIILSSVAAASFGLGVFTHRQMSRKKATGKGKEDSTPQANNKKSMESSYKAGAGSKSATQKPAPGQVIKLPVADAFPLRLGSKGKRVERLQVWLMRNYGHTGRVTGIFDENTEALVKRFLKAEKVSQELFYEKGMDKPVHEQTLIR